MVTRCSYYISTDCAQQANGVDNLICNGLVNSNSGCGVTDWSKASYGPYFDSQGGGIFAMKWDEIGIAVCMSFVFSLQSCF